MMFSAPSSLSGSVDSRLKPQNGRACYWVERDPAKASTPSPRCPATARSLRRCLVASIICPSVRQKGHCRHKRRDIRSPWTAAAHLYSRTTRPAQPAPSRPLLSTKHNSKSASSSCRSPLRPSPLPSTQPPSRRAQKSVNTVSSVISPRPLSRRYSRIPCKLASHSLRGPG